uniref:WD_REPEATS_REGION domain-containing protein n=1 Tax=Heligmosomoides polygyrus TaxID=6339 RepID=A0A183GET0_HELPZ
LLGMLHCALRKRAPPRIPDRIHCRRGEGVLLYAISARFVIICVLLSSLLLFADGVVICLFAYSRILTPIYSFAIATFANEGEVYDVLWLSTDLFASGGTDKRVRLWKVDPRGRPAKMSSLVGCNQAVTRLDFDTESRLLLGASNDNGVRLWNVDNQRLMTSFMGHTDKVSSARFISSTQVVSGSNDRLIKLWDVRSQRCVRSVFPGSTILDIVGISKGVATFTSGHFDRKLRFWDSRNQEPVHTVEMAGKITSLDTSPDGVHILCSTRDDTLSLMDIRKYQTVHIYSAEHYRTSSDLSRCVLSPGMEYCAAGSADGNVFIWNVQSTKLERILHKGGHEHAVLSLSWNPSGQGLLSADKQKIVCLWR